MRTLVPLAIGVVMAIAPLAAGNQPQPSAPAPGRPMPGAPPGQQTPTRDTGGRQTPAKGTAALKGVVVDAVSGLPVRRARVSAFGMSGPPATGGSTVTDADGRFAITDLSAGRYSVSVSKNGYLPLQYGQKQVNQPGTPIDLADGQTIEKIVIGLSRGGVITGRVLDDLGDPVLGAEVRALRFRYVNGRRQLATASAGRAGSSTDDLGQFRLYGLEPGPYYIAAAPSRDWSPFAARDQGPGFADTFFPGTASAAEARTVVVQAGRETQGIVFTLVTTRMARVRGRAFMSSGEPFASGSIDLTYRDPMLGGMRGTSGGSVRPDGSFELPNVAPGEYLISVRVAGSREETDGEVARQYVTVDGEDVDGVVLVGSRGAVARGRIITDEGIPLTLPSRNLRVAAESMDPGRPYSLRQTPKINDDWTFEITGLFDRLRVTANIVIFSPPQMDNANWMLKGVFLDGRDVTDTGIDFAPGQSVEGIEVVFTRTPTRVTGRLLDDRGAPATGTIVAFSDDETLWLPQSSRIRTTRPAPDGQYRLMLRPADDYLIAAVPQVEDGQWWDPEFLRGLKQVASRLSLTEGQSTVQDLKLVKLP